MSQHGQQEPQRDQDLKDLDAVLAEITGGGWRNYWQALDEDKPLAPIYDLLPSPVERKPRRSRRPLSHEEIRAEFEREANRLKGSRRTKATNAIEEWFDGAVRFREARAQLRRLIDRAIDMAKAVSVRREPARTRRLLYDLERLRPWTMATDRYFDLGDMPSCGSSVIADLKKRRDELLEDRVAHYHDLGPACQAKVATMGPAAFDPGAAAVAMKVRDPTLTVVKIAKELGVSRQSLYRDKRFTATLQMLATEIPKGQKDPDGTIEAWAE